MTLRFALVAERPPLVAADAVVVGVHDGGALTPAAAELDTASGGAIRRAMQAGDVTAKAGTVTRLLGLPGVTAPRVLLVGLGEAGAIDAARYAKACTEAAKALKTGPAKRVASYLPEVEVAGRDARWRWRHAAVASDAPAYRYTATVKPKNGEGLAELLLSGAGPDAERALAEGAAIAAGVRLAKELGNLPPNICNPGYLADQARRIAAEERGVRVEVLDRDAMHALGMGSLLGVAQGSANPPQLICLEYRGAGEGVAPYALVGKGITFDTGGICIKPGAGMEEMKFDMMGAASVMGAFLAAVRLALPINLVCVVPAVENMPDGQSYRPGDVVTSMSGRTIEVINTDAEGRLILCDALTWVQRFEPRAIVDAATLTGACVVALGKHAHGLMTQHDDLAAELLAAGEAALDRAWRLPLWDDYQQQLESAFADVANVGGKSAGAITAGCFLARFVEGRRWAHLDIAGTAWDEGRKGMATGRPVALLVQWLMDRAAG